jgi:hypothetical protein
MLLTVLAIWLCLAVPTAALVAALGRSALREDAELGHLAGPVVAASTTTTGARRFAVNSGQHAHRT